MNNSDVSFFLLIGMITICVSIAVQMKWYKVAVWKSLFVSLAIIVTGLYSCRLWFYLENGYWMGRSFFGAIFFAPLTFVLVAKLIRTRYLHALDFCAVAGCMVFAILKIECIVEGCCAGIVLFLNEEYEYIRFPSAEVEFITSFILAIILLLISKKEKNRGKIYPITLVSYGMLRFFLNLLRDDWDRAQEMNLLIPLGNIWSLVAIAIGITWLAVVNKKNSVVKNI